MLRRESRDINVVAVVVAVIAAAAVVVVVVVVVVIIVNVVVIVVVLRKSSLSCFRAMKRWLVTEVHSCLVVRSSASPLPVL